MTDAPDLIESHPNLSEALVAALAEVAVVEKGSTADAGSYSYDYADLAAVVKASRPHLAKHGLVALTPVHEHGNGLACTVILLHSSGERMDLGPLPFPHGQNAQATGSMITYHRRYALTAALGMATGEDDDGAAAAPRQDADPVAGLRSSLAGAIRKLDQPREDALKAWFHEQRLPKVEVLTADQCDQVLDHLMSLPVDPGEADDREVSEPVEGLDTSPGSPTEGGA